MLADGVLISSIYAVLALSLWLLWSVGRVVNLAHGDLALCGAYAAWWLNAEHNWEPLAALLVVVPVALLVALLVNRFVLAHLFLRPLLTSAVVTLGLSIAIQATLRGMFTAMPHAPTGNLVSPWRLGPVALSAGQTLSAISAVVIIVLWVVASHRTRTGRGLLAVAQNPSAANVIGIDIPRMAAFAVVLAVTLAVASGSLLGQFQWIQPSVGPALTVKVFAVAALSGLRSIRAVVVAAIAFGVLEAALFAIAPLSAARIAMMLGAGLVLGALAIRPAVDTLRASSEPGR